MNRKQSGLPIENTGPRYARNWERCVGLTDTGLLLHKANHGYILPR